MSTPPRILITITGMGNPLAGDTTEWAQEVFPGAVLESSAERRWLRDGVGKIFLLEVSYEDVNEAIRQKFEGVQGRVATAVPDAVKSVLDEYVGDVCTNVFVKDALNAAQRRFVDAYGTALRIAIEERQPGEDLTRAKLGVLCHSLGTLIAFEGLHAASASSFITRPLRANLVMCAPMLSPIGAVQEFVQQQRYLTVRKCNKPTRYETIGRCMALYDTSDPFFVIQAPDYYASKTQTLVDKYEEFDSRPGVKVWEGHAMIGSYLRNNRESIKEFLFQ